MRDGTVNFFAGRMNLIGDARNVLLHVEYSAPRGEKSIVMIAFVALVALFRV